MSDRFESFTAGEHLALSSAVLEAVNQAIETHDLPALAELAVLALDLAHADPEVRQQARDVRDALYSSTPGELSAERVDELGSKLVSLLHDDDAPLAELWRASIEFMGSPFDDFEPEEQKLLYDCLLREYDDVWAAVESGDPDKIEAADARADLLGGLLVGLFAANDDIKPPANWDARWSRLIELAEQKGGRA
jgi:hypothetical protein